MTLEQVKII